MLEEVERASTAPALTSRRQTLAYPHFNHLYQQGANTPQYWVSNQSNANYVSAASLLRSTDAGK